jgi:hypothetical protein
MFPLSVAIHAQKRGIFTAIGAKEPKSGIFGINNQCFVSGTLAI